MHVNTDGFTTRGIQSSVKYTSVRKHSVTQPTGHALGGNSASLQRSSAPSGGSIFSITKSLMPGQPQNPIKSTKAAMIKWWHHCWHVFLQLLNALIFQCQSVFQYLRFSPSGLRNQVVKTQVMVIQNFTQLLESACVIPRLLGRLHVQTVCNVLSECPWPHE